MRIAVAHLAHHTVAFIKDPFQNRESQVVAASLFFSDQAKLAYLIEIIVPARNYNIENYE